MVPTSNLGLTRSGIAMKHISRITAAVALLAFSSGLALAQHQDDRRYHQGQGHDWHQGERVDHDEWRHSRVVDYRHEHLRPPPRGYEWRYYDGRYILAAIATGVIADIILNAR